MKHVRYILYGKPVDPAQLGVIALPAAVVAVPFLTVLLAGAVIMDSARYIRLKYLLHQREIRREKYIKCVLRSLNCKTTPENINLLKAA